MHIIQVEVSAIVVPDDRFRGINKKVEDIATSILKYGQLQPIIITPEGVLVDGGHRLAAAKLNCSSHIAAVYSNDVDPLYLREVELEANIMRLEMTWQEKAHALKTLHELKVARNPNASQAQTAAAAGEGSQRAISQAISISRMVELFPEIGEAKSLNQALSLAKAKAKGVMRVKEVRDDPEVYAAIEDKLILGDSVEVIKTIPDHTFNAIITDPPFGINYDDRKAGTVGSITDYEDGPEAYERLLTMAPDLYRTIKPDGWLIWFLGVSWYERCKAVFRDAGFIVDEIPVIWDRSQGRCFTTRPDRYFGRAYDIALHCIKGDPQMVLRSRPNIIRVEPVSNADRETLVERPVELYAELIRRLTVPGETVADFFAGSGSCLAAAASTGRRYFGVEMNPERRAWALKKIRAHTRDDAA